MYDEETQNHPRDSQPPSPPDRYYSDSPQQCIHDAAEAVVAARFRDLDEARFMRTGGHRRYKVKGVDARVALAATVAECFYQNASAKPEEIWWALANHGLDLTYLQRGAVALLTRKNELLEVVRTIHALMPYVALLAERGDDERTCGGSDGG
ncbi:hypothetical protein H5368_06130 [Luteimonas sp. MC1782]|uniref:hypothetical protein n=1 Tax=Luteimonas sp. MC1782 TaxID=2760305 RepID=UPI0015FEECBF|nr:hypothetical protein [Luteimonas sp. MC1782]MBB1472601.1 hypothetical protein [Luteimonas sp. MC1782]